MESHSRWFPRPRLHLLLLGITSPLWITIVPRAAASEAPKPGAESTPERGAQLAPKPTQIRYEGTVWFEAHFRRPHETRLYNSEAVYTADGRGRARLDWTTWAKGDSARVPETSLVVGDSVFHRDAPGKPWQLLTGDKRRLERLQVMAGIPWELGRLAQSQKRIGQGDFLFDGPQFVYTERRAHPRLGDVIDSVALMYVGTERLPQEALLVVHDLHQEWRLVQRRVGSPTGDFPESLLQSPATFEPSTEVSDSLIGEPKIVPVAPGLWAAEMEDIDSRSMFVEFADHLALIEVALSSGNGERLVDAARRRWPDKPIRYVLFSHHHPHYLGGIRALIAEGATVVTTPGNEAFVREISTLLFGLEPDRLARTARRVKIRTFKDRLELADSTNRLVAINYGERSQHTDEFVVFWFPRAKLLFESELGWVRVDGKLRASRRAAKLLDWLKEQRLDVDQFVQSWPMRDNEASRTRAELEALVKSARR